MVVRSRFRAVLLCLGGYGVAGCLCAYFIHNAQIGTRGLSAKQLVKVQIHETARELEAAKAERTEWDRRLALLRADQIDRDLLEERGRILLGRVHRNDLVIVTP